MNSRGEPLGLDHQALLAPLIAASGSPLSEYSFANLFLFREAHAYRVVTEPFVHVLGVTYDGLRHAMPLAPLAALDRGTVDVLLDHADGLYPMAEADLAAAGELGLVARAHDADSDYLYDSMRLSTFRGRAIRRKRSQAMGFWLTMKPVAAPIDDGSAAGAAAVLDGWLADVDRAAADTDHAACRAALAHRAELALEGILVSSGDGEPLGFLLAGILPDGSKAVHFAKGRRAHAGVYPWMFACFAARSGVARLNFEQDLGKPGFARAKQAFDPVARLAKYRLFRGDTA